MSEQLALFDNKNLNPIAQVKEAMRLALKESKMSREQVVDQMTGLAIAYGIPHREGRSNGITVDMMEKWVATSATHCMPWKLLPIFCEVTKNNLPMIALANAVGARLIHGEDITLLQWARMERNVKKLRKNQKILEQKLDPR